MASKVEILRREYVKTASVSGQGDAGNAGGDQSRR